MDMLYPVLECHLVLCKLRVKATAGVLEVDTTGSVACHTCSKLLKENKQEATRSGVACSKCEEVFATEVLMKRHALSHTNKAIHQCTLCPYRTGKKSDLAKHTLIHTGSKPHACTKCDYRSTQRGTLKNHLLTHGGEKPFACNQCDFRFTVKSNMKRHIMRKHAK